MQFHTRLNVTLFATIGIAAMPCLLSAQSSDSIRFDAQTRVFRIDAADQTYAFGINDAKALQPIYWGQGLDKADTLAAAHTDAPVASFDSAPTTTPNEYAGWGSGLFVEPALKVAFPDGNRDLVLQYVSHTIQGNDLNVILKDIARDVVVELRYTVDPRTGILGRSAVISNRTPA